MPQNNAKMKAWLLDRYASSTFHTCPHRALPCMEGPQVAIPADPEAIPRACHTPVSSLAGMSVRWPPPRRSSGRHRGSVIWRPSYVVSLDGHYTKARRLQLPQYISRHWTSSVNMRHFPSSQPSNSPVASPRTFGRPWQMPVTPITVFFYAFLTATWPASSHNLAASTILGHFKASYDRGTAKMAALMPS